MPSRTWIESGTPSAVLPDSSALSSFLLFSLSSSVSVSLLLEIEKGYSMRAAITTEIKIVEEKKKKGRRSPDLKFQSYWGWFMGDKLVG